MQTGSRASWIQIGQSPNEPTPERRNRGVITLKPGGPGVADTLRFQRKNSSDTYDRVTLATVNDLHDALTVSDSDSVNLTLSGQDLSAEVLPAGVDHNSLANLATGNPHTQYLLKAGGTISGTLAVGDTLTANGSLTANGVLTANGPVVRGGGVPSATAEVAAGSGAGVSVAGVDDGFRLVLITGTGTTTGKLMTVTFAASRGGTEYIPQLGALDSDSAAALANVWPDYLSRTTVGFEIWCNAALPTSRSHIFSVTVTETTT